VRGRVAGACGEVEEILSPRGGRSAIKGSGYGVVEEFCAQEIFVCSICLVDSLKVELPVRGTL
jgi:hypothetical protein